jgi:hypothetical protein
VLPSSNMPVSNTTSGDRHIVRYKRLQRGCYYADFRQDKRLNPQVYHCVIQREGSTEIIRWTQHRTLEDAIRTAESELTRLSREPDTGQELLAQPG